MLTQGWLCLRLPSNGRDVPQVLVPAAAGARAMHRTLQGRVELLKSAGASGCTRCLCLRLSLVGASSVSGTHLIFEALSHCALTCARQRAGFEALRRCRRKLVGSSWRPLKERSHTGNRKGVPRRTAGQGEFDHFLSHNRHCHAYCLI